jgi:hypothetical protein
MLKPSHHHITLTWANSQKCNKKQIDVTDTFKDEEHGYNRKRNRGKEMGKIGFIYIDKGWMVLPYWVGIQQNYLRWA